MNSPVIRSIDVGYGNTKFILSVDERGPRTMTFPSIAPPLSGSEIVPSANHLKNCKEIDVNGTAYQVGPDAGVARSKTYVDRLDDEYVLSDQYLALARGAMAYMDIDRIDYLVVGLPLRTLKTRSAELKSRLTGPHPMPNGKSILVKDVSTVIQPLGAFFHWMVTNKRLKQSGFAKERTLVVDPGFRTFDWMVTEGPNPIADLCGSVANGMSDVLTRMAEDISGTINAPVTDIRSLDVRWRENGEARFFGQPHDLNKHTEVAVQVAKDAIAALGQKVGSGIDVDHIVLAGGGAFFYESLLKDTFHRHNVQLVPEPLFANVRGFQILGMEKAARARVSAKTLAA